jgi:hypothetical protein
LIHGLTPAETALAEFWGRMTEGVVGEGFEVISKEAGYAFT